MPFRLLHEDLDQNGVRFHSDMLNPVPTVLSRKRAAKVNKAKQISMEEKGICLVCEPEKLEGKPMLDFHVKYNGASCVASFGNSAPYMPIDQRVLYMWHKDLSVRRKTLHIIHMQDVRKVEFYSLLKACVELGKKASKEKESAHELYTTDRTRMVVGFNFGPMAGQSLPHIHCQYGWEYFMENLTIRPEEMELYYSELRRADLVLHESDRPEFKLVAPWTPRGQYALDMYFPMRYEIHQLKEEELKVFAHFTALIFARYKELGICNANIVIESSPLGCKILPVIVHFIPRVNVVALYEMLGRNVVDTPPETTYSDFRGLVPKWDEAISEALAFDPEKEYNDIIKEEEDARQTGAIVSMT